MTFLIAEIHPANLVLAWCLSFLFRVQAYRLHPACPRVFTRRIDVLDLDKYFSKNAIHCFRSDVVQLWEKASEKFPVESWSVRYHGRQLDFSTKAKKGLSVHFEWLNLLRELQGRERLSSRTYILDSLQVSVS